MRPDVLSTRTLNRATLARQLLLAPSPFPPLAALEHLVGLQAQVPGDPYTALHARLQGFDRRRLSALVEERRAVRTALMRGTIHLVTTEDALELRPLVQPVLDRELARHPEHGPALRDADLGPVLDVARALFAERPRTAAELREALAERFRGESPAALAYACRNHLALVHVPPRGLWGRRGPIASTTLEAWTGRAPASDPSLADVVLRYLGAFGPASAADVATWSGLTGLRPVLEPLRPRLRAFRDERGRELFDPPDAARPDPETPAPPRFLPEYDNALLSHADRSRFVTDGERRRLARVSGLGHGTLLLDGRAVARWRVERESRGRATLVVRHLRRLAPTADDQLAAEAERLLQFLAPDAAGRELTFLPLDG